MSPRRKVLVNLFVFVLMAAYMIGYELVLTHRSSVDIMHNTPRVVQA